MGNRRRPLVGGTIGPTSELRRTRTGVLLLRLLEEEEGVDGVEEDEAEEEGEGVKGERMAGEGEVSGRLGLAQTLLLWVDHLPCSCLPCKLRLYQRFV